MKAISIKEARSLFSSIVQEAEHGTSIEITRHGKPVARIVPIPQEAKKLPSMKAFRDAQPLLEKSLTETLLEMRQEERY